MAGTVAVGDGPIVYSDGGQQKALPLSAISFDLNGADTKPPATGRLKSWLAYLVAQGRLAPGPAPAPSPAMVVTASSPGSTGNDIVVHVASNSSDPATPRADVTVTEENVYAGLTLDPASASFIETVLGRVGGPPGTRPGLVLVRPVATLAPDPAGGDGGTSSSDPVWTFTEATAIPPATSPRPSFVLEPRSAGSVLGEWTTVNVSQVQQPATGRATFTLRVVWSKVVPAVRTLADLNTPPKLAFAVNIDAPADGFKLPAPGSYFLIGGAEQSPATKASATLLANS